MRVLGFMSGTSLDAVDMAVLETDVEAIAAFGPAGEKKLSEPTRNKTLAATWAARAWVRGTPEPLEFAPCSRAVAEEHYSAAYAFLAWRTLRGDFTIGDLTFLAGSFRRLRNLLEGLLIGFSQVAGQALYLDDLFSFFDIQP